MIQEDPEKFGHAATDKAIWIQERIQDERNKNAQNVNIYKKKMDKLRAGHFERMMPKQPIFFKDRFPPIRKI